MSEYAPSAVDLLWHVNGFVQAFARFEERRLLRDPQDAYDALFECLAWASSIDERLDYPTASPELRGLRYARHRVHHQWADALYIDDGAQFPLQFPIVFFEYRWRDVNDLPPGRANDPDHAHYRSYLAGQPARFTLGAALGFLRSIPGGGPV